MSTVYKKDYDYPVEANRYRLVVAYPCPFAHRTAIARQLLGLEDVVSLGLTSSIKTDKIWDFSNQPNHLDPVLQVEFVSELYKNTDTDYDGPYSVPALVDTENGKVVNQESLDIVLDFATRFKEFHKADAPDLYPEDKREEIDQWITKIGSDVIGAGGRAGMADNQPDYEQYFNLFFNTLGEIDLHLATHDYLVGDTLTVADIILFTPLVRFDVTMYSANRLNLKHLTEYEHLWPYMHKLYQLPAFKDTTDFEGIKRGTYLGKNGQAKFKQQIVPIGPDISKWEQPL